MSTPRQQQGGLSITTLAIASAASVAAAIVVHELWRGGAILGAAITPVVVAVVSESLRRPVNRVSTLREERRTRTHVRTGQAPPPPPPELERADPFGIWQDEGRPTRRRLDRRHLKLALATGAVAFLVGGFALTGAELVLGGNVGGGRDTTIIPGGGSRERDREEERTTTTETEPQETAPETTPTQPPDEATTTPPPTTPTEPAPGETPPPTTPETMPPPAPPPPAETIPPAQPTP